MESQRTFSREDTGKEVVTAAGDVVGTVVDANDESAAIDPHDDLSTELMEELGWDTTETETYVITTDQVSGITEETVQLGGTSVSQ